MNFRRIRTESVDINLTPLIDVVFLLLIFFMVSTTFTRESRVDINLPESTSGLAAPEEQMIEIVIDRNGHYRINGLALANHDLTTLIQALAEMSQNQNLPVVIAADENTPYQAVITALDAAAKNGLNKITLPTSRAQ